MTVASYVLHGFFSRHAVCKGCTILDESLVGYVAVLYEDSLVCETAERYNRAIGLVELADNMFEF